MYIIQNKNDEELYWSNQWGWCDIDEADRFSEDEKNTLNLPLEGKWRKCGN